MNTTISRDYSFSAGHILPNHIGKCSSLHGHNYRVQVSVTGNPEVQPGSSSEGMVIDFGDLDRVVKPIIDSLDHHFLTAGDELPIKMIDFLIEMFEGTEEGPDLDLYRTITRAKNTWFVYLNVRTTAENIAAYIWRLIRTHVDLKSQSVQVTVWETDKSSATFPEV